MNEIALALALLGMLIVGILVGLAWRGMLLIGDRRALDRLSAGIEAEQRMRAATQAAMAASRQAVRDHQFGQSRPGGSR